MGNCPLFLKAISRVEIQYNFIYSCEKFPGREHDKDKTSSSHLEQSCKEPDGASQKDTGTEERTRQVGNLEHSSKMQKGRTLKDIDTTERSDTKERRGPIDDLQDSEEQGGSTFKDKQKRINAEESKPVSHDFTNEVILTSVDTVNDDEANWGELGPIVVQRYEERVSSSNENSLQDNRSPDVALLMQLQEDFDMSSLQSSGYSDTLVYNAEQTRSADSCIAAEGKNILRSEENNAGLQTLDVPCKDSEKSNLQTKSYENLDGLVDCSGCNTHLDTNHFLTAELGGSSLTMRNSKNQMKNRKGQILFQQTATGSNNDAVDSLVESILSTLKTNVKPR